MRAYAQLTTSYVIYVNRVGVDESITFWGGSHVVGPDGADVFKAPLHDEGLYLTEIDLDAIRRERISLPLLRDERPEAILRQLERIVRERADAEEHEPGADSTASTDQTPSVDGRATGRIEMPREARR
jgi:hypothetical protein